MMVLIFCYYLLVICLVDGAKDINCPKSDTTFVKVFGGKPASVDNPVLLYENEPPQPVTAECIAKCLNNDQCFDFVLYYNLSSCYWYKNGRKSYAPVPEISDPNSVWFSKTCLKAKNNCQRSWAFERVIGATLVVHRAKTLPQKATTTQCQQNCIDEKDFVCKSANFKSTKNEDHLGTCSLIESDRHFFPNSYRASNFYDEYLENQCVNVNASEFCSYEEYENVTLSHIDGIYNKQTREGCRKMCESIVAFSCRGYSIVPENTENGLYTCLLHSEDTKIHGPKLLKPTNFGIYYERARCLNVTVSCTDSHLTVRYQPEVDFFGRLYMQGYSESIECYTKGQGRKTLNLRIPLLQNQCGITRAKADSRNLLSGLMVIQYNAQIQTQGDRLLRVGCVFRNDDKVLLGTGVNITVSQPNGGTTVVNSSVEAPIIEMKILDLSTQNEASNTEIGQELQMVIQITPPNGPYDIWAGHLIAMTEDSAESILLLDDRGCPTNLNIFPAFTRIHTNDTQKLVANFQAFKFASSPIVRFSVVVQFCPQVCPEVNCGSTTNKLKREVQSRLVQQIDGTKVIQINRTAFGEGQKGRIEELPMEYVMLVRDPKLYPDRYVLGERNKILVAGYDPAANEVCIDYSLFIALIITWVLVQIIFFVCCAMLIRRYKKYYEDETMRQSLEELHRNFGLGFSNLDGSRRVHWADNN